MKKCRCLHPFTSKCSKTSCVLWLHVCHFEIKQKHRVLLRVAAKMVCLPIFANVKSATKKKKTSSFCHADVQNQNITSIESLTFFANHLFQNCKSLQEQMFKNCANLPSTYIFSKKKMAKLFNSMPEEGRRIFC